MHLRHPVQLWRELGTNGFLQFNLFVGGTPILASDGRVYDSLAAWRRTGLGAGDAIRP